MKAEDEQSAVAKVAEGLVEEHPGVSPSTINEIVDEEYHALDGAPVRDFVAPLVKHAAQGRIRETAGESVERGESTMASARDSSEVSETASL